MLTKAMAKELSAASAHECLFVDFQSVKEPKKVLTEKDTQTLTMMDTTWTRKALQKKPNLPVKGWKLSSLNPQQGRKPAILQKKFKEEFNTSPNLSSSDDTQKDIKLEDLSKLVQDVGVDFMDLDSLKDDEPIFVQDDIDEEFHAKKVQTGEPKETTNDLAPHPPSLNSLPTELKELPLRFNELIGEVKELNKHVHDLEIELPRDLKEINTKLETFTLTVKSLATQIFKSASKKIRDHYVPSVGLAGSHPVKEEKNTQQVTISHPLRRSPQPVGELIKTDKGKKAMSSKDANEEGTDSEFDEANLTGFRIESSKLKKLNQFDFIIEKGKHIHLTSDQIKEKKNLEELAKADIAKQEVKLGKEELVDLLGINVVTKYYKANL
nr:hypothetical protein [Tanacetum cinerariifolium]